MYPNLVMLNIDTDVESEIFLHHEEKGKSTAMLECDSLPFILLFC